MIASAYHLQPRKGLGAPLGNGGAEGGGPLGNLLPTQFSSQNGSLGEAYVPSLSTGKSGGERKPGEIPAAALGGADPGVQKRILAEYHYQSIRKYRNVQNNILIETYTSCIILYSYILSSQDVALQT